MNFYYDPIIGLKYKYIEPVLIVDINTIPEEMSVDTFIQKVKENRDLFPFTGIDIYPQVTVFSEITELVDIY